MTKAMKLDIGQHLQEVDFEQYSMGTLPVERIAPFEEHLMACDCCQDELLEMEAYVNAVRSVSPKLRPVEKSRWESVRTRLYGWPRWAGAVATVAAAMLIAGIWIPSPAAGPTAVVLLHTSRGIEGLAVATAVAGQPLSLEIDPAELVPSASYRMEIVQSTGKPVAQSDVAPKDGKIVLSLGSGLAGGQYYIRLYNATGELLREYGFNVR